MECLGLSQVPFDELASCIWALGDGQRPVSGIRHDDILAEFEVGGDGARQDMAALMRQLAVVGVVERV